MNIEIHSATLSELMYMIELHQEHGAANAMESVENMVAYILGSVADGSRRPGSWEREMLYSMGLIADSNAHEIYRSCYGKPK